MLFETLYGSIVMASDDDLMDRYQVGGGGQGSYDENVPNIVKRFVRMLDEKGYQQAVEVCPYDGREGGFQFANEAIDVYEEFIVDVPDADESPEGWSKAAELVGLMPPVSRLHADMDEDHAREMEEEYERDAQLYSGDESQ
jgi:hypothetical protein